MQFLKIDKNTTLSKLSSVVTSGNVDAVLAANNLNRSPNIGEQFQKVCDAAIETTSKVPAQTKTKILNQMSGSLECFERAALQNSDDWKVLASLGTFPDMLKVPDTINLPNSASTFGNDNVSVPKKVFTSVMDAVSKDKEVDPSVFGTVRQVADVRTAGTLPASGETIYDSFQLPWGKVTLWSDLLQQSIDFPCYPIDPSESRSANYTEMPDMLYQYEPWWLFQNNGPRSPNYKFIMHREMFTGDPRDGRLNELIRFCEASLFPKYNGSAVNTDTVRLYIAGKLLIAGKLVSVDKEWSGPLLLDDWYAVCTLTLTINEVSDTPLNFDTVRTKGLIG